MLYCQTAKRNPDLSLSLHPTDPHWHLAVIGVAPAHQGEGHGDALMAYALAQCDRDRVPAYLESEPAQHVVLPAPRLRTARRDPGRFVAHARPDAAATALSFRRAEFRMQIRCGGS